MIRFAKLILLLVVGLQPQSASAQVNKTDSLLRSFRDRYEGGKKWYPYMTFSQRVEYFVLDETGQPKAEEVWHEAASFPGKLLIKYVEKDNSDGILLLSDSLYSFHKGVAAPASYIKHPLMQFAFDLYFIPVEITIERMQDWEIDVEKISFTQWKGQPAWVIGAQPGDDTTPQVWYDTRGCFLRCVVREGNNVQDMEFNDYRTIQGHPVATSVWFKRNGALVMVEYYYDIRLPDSLPDYYFDPKKFNDIVLE